MEKPQPKDFLLAAPKEVCEYYNWNKYALALEDYIAYLESRPVGWEGGGAEPKPKCPYCNDSGWLYDACGQENAVCSCHH